MKGELLKNVRLNIGYLLKDEDGHPFGCRAALLRARKRRNPQFTCGGKRCAPQNGDYAIVLEDRRCEKKDGEYPITRYGFYNGKWVFQYIVGYPTGKNEKRRKP